MTSPGAARFYIVHEAPAERRASNYMAHVDLAPFDLGGQLEQVWLHDLGDGAFALACIPFMSYGLALGDEVRLSEHGIVTDVILTRGHRVLRLLLTDDSDKTRLKRTTEAITAVVAEAGLLSEWHGARFIAVDVPPDTHPQAVFDAMQRVVNEGRGYWEWADARPFAAV